MKNLLSIELLKVKSYRTFWILIGFFVVLLPLWNYTIAAGIMKMGAGDINILNQAYSFSNVWQNLGWWASIFVVFISVLVIIVTTNEYQFRTNRQHVIDGWERMDFYHAKWQLVLLLSIGTTLFVFILGLIFGSSYGTWDLFPGSVKHLFYFWLLCLNYYSFSLLLAFLFKRSGITIGIFFLYSMIIETMLAGVINWATDTKYGLFMPLQSSDELLPFPLMDMAKAMVKSEGVPSATLLASVAGGWIILYYILGRQKLLRSDW